MTVLDNIKNLEEKIKNTQEQIDENNKTLKDLIQSKERQEQLLNDYLFRGFAISEKTNEKIFNWEVEHHMKCRNRYIEYVFVKTEVGTALSVRCPKCKKELTGLCCSNDPLYSDSK